MRIGGESSLHIDGSETTVGDGTADGTSEGLEDVRDATGC